MSDHEDDPVGKHWDSLRRPLGKVFPPLKTIRRFCLECMGGSSIEVDVCTDEACHLYPFRYGKDPRRKKRKLSGARLERARENMRRIQEKKRGV